MLIASKQATNKKTPNGFVGSVRLPKLEKITHEKRRRPSQLTLKTKIMQPTWIREGRECLLELFLLL
jgi:hypothetical protein